MFDRATRRNWLAVGGGVAAVIVLIAVVVALTRGGGEEERVQDRVCRIGSQWA